jgi:hypothetical protein
MDKELKDNKNDKRWDRVERTVIILTFVFTAITSSCSIRTANRTVMQMNNELRPWVSLSQISTSLQEDSMLIGQFIENVGRIPCYVKTEGVFEYINNGILKEVKGPDALESLILMPGQKITYDFEIKGTCLEEIIAKKRDIDYLIAVKVYYSENKDRVDKYFTYNKSRLRIDRVPNVTSKNKKYVFGGIWANVESSFK